MPKLSMHAFISVLANFAVAEGVLAQIKASLSSHSDSKNSAKKNANNKNVNNRTTDLVNDSREVKQGDIFCAILGSALDGRKYISKAIAQGASFVLSQCEHAEAHGKLAWQDRGANKIAVLNFYQLDFHLIDLAKYFYQQPQQSLCTIGVTGTNGKTSTTQIIAKLLASCGNTCGVIGTNGVGLLGDLKPLVNTTPAPTQLMKFFADFTANNIQHIVMEVSSHALAQRRVSAELFNIAVFTNLTRDHLDYHQTMENYAKAKAQIFTTETINHQPQIAIINGDDKQGQIWLNNPALTENAIVYGRKPAIKNYSRFVFANHLQHLDNGIKFTLESYLGSQEVHSKLMGDFNVDNLLAAIAVLMAKNISFEKIMACVQSVTPILGRMETIKSNNKATAIVDYAHTPDGLKNALMACKQHCFGDVWVVFGCGGDRDKGKRPLMGAIAEQLAEHVVISNDNPRHESPEIIAQDILSGCRNTAKIAVMLDRQRAVIDTLTKAKAKDFVLLAGKGHEDYIQIAGQTIPYNERQLVHDFYAKQAEL